MARDPLLVLHRLRGIALDAARRALSERLREEAAARARAAALDAAVTQETGRQAAMPVEARTADAFAAWLRHAQQQQLAALDSARASAAASETARGALGEARAAKRALEAALDMAEQARQTAAARAEQRALDEAAGRSGRPGSRWSG